MSSRSSRVRTKIVALLVSLAALWGFAAFVTIREGLNLLAVSTLDTGIAEPAETLLPALQAERRLTAVYLGSGSSSDHAAMVAQRAQTDTAIATFRSLAGSDKVRFAASDALRPASPRPLPTSMTSPRRTGGTSTPAGSNRVEATAVFTDIVDSMFRIYDSMATLDDQDIAKRRPDADQPDPGPRAAVAGGRAARRCARRRRTHHVGAGALRRSWSAPSGSSTRRPSSICRRPTAPATTRWSRALPTSGSSQLEDAFVARSGPDLTPVSSASDWNAATEPVLVELKQLVRGRRRRRRRPGHAGRHRRHRPAGAGRRSRPDRRHRVHHHLDHHRPEPGPPARAAAQRRPRPRLLPAAPGGGAAAARRAGRRRRRGATAGLRPRRDRPGRSGVQPGPGDRDPGRRRAGRAAPQRPRRLPQPGPAQPGPAAPPARPARRDGAAGHRLRGAGRTVPHRPPRHPHAAQRGEPDRALRRHRRPGLAQAGAHGRRAARRAGRGRGLHPGHGAAGRHGLAARPGRRRRHPPAGRADRERGVVLPAADRGPGRRLGGRQRLRHRDRGPRPGHEPGGARGRPTSSCATRPSSAHQHRPARPLRGRQAGRAPRHPGPARPSRRTAAPPPIVLLPAPSWPTTGDGDDDERSPDRRRWSAATPAGTGQEDDRGRQPDRARRAHRAASTRPRPRRRAGLDDQQQRPQRPVAHRRRGTADLQRAPAACPPTTAVGRPVASRSHRPPAGVPTG